MKPGGQSTPLPPVYWLNVHTGWVWMESRFHRGRVILRRAKPRGFWPEIRAYRAADDPGTGGLVLGAPGWMRTAKP